MQKQSRVISGRRACSVPSVSMELTAITCVGRTHLAAVVRVQACAACSSVTGASPQGKRAGLRKGKAPMPFPLLSNRPCSHPPDLSHSTGPRQWHTGTRSEIGDHCSVPTCQAVTLRQEASQACRSVHLSRKLHTQELAGREREADLSTTCRCLLRVTARHGRARSAG